MHRFLIITILFGLYACSFPDIESTLRTSGPNRPELERVLEHYRNTGDAERYRAACFLVENMRGRYSLSGPSLDKYNAERSYLSLTLYVMLASSP